MDRRKVIALLMGNAGLRSDYQGMLRGGVERACVERNIDLWVYAGRSDWRPSGPAQSHVYQLVSPHRIDGIILAAGCIASFLSVEDVLAMVKQRCPVPICAVGQHVAGTPSIVTDNREGAARVARHLAGDHNCRRFAYIAGPPAHEESTARLDATREALMEFGVELAPEAVVHGNFSKLSGVEGARELLERLGRLDALIAANDDMAIGAINALSHAGIRCPDEILVAGFDDSPSARSCSPTLTTARQPVAQLGALGVTRLAQAWSGDCDVGETAVPTEVVIRESCGCDPTAALDRPLSGGALDDTLHTALQELLTPLLDEAAHRRLWADRFCTALQQEQRAEAPALQKTLAELLEHLAQTDRPILELQRVISLMRQTHRREAGALDLEDTFHRAMVQVGNALHRRNVTRQLHDERLMEEVRESWEHLATSMSLSELQRVLAVELPRFSIQNAMIAVYAQGDNDSLLPLVCLTDGARVELGGKPYPAPLLIPDGGLATRKRCSLTVLPLTFEWEQLGVALLELPPNHEIYAMLREQIGSAIKTAYLQERTSAQAQAEKKATAERLHSLRVIAGGVAHDLNNALGPLVALPDIMRRNLVKASVGEPPTAVLEDLDTLQQAAQRAADMIRDLLTLGQTDAAPMGPLELNRLLEEERRAFSRLCERTRGVSLELATSDQPLMLYAAKTNVVRAVSNLVANAADAMQSAGPVKIRAFERVLSGRLEGIDPIDPGRYAVVEVQDHGCGIPRESLDRILEPFYTSKKRHNRSGTGLGLAIVHRIVKDSLGYVHVESQVDVGTTFSLYFPLYEGDFAGESSRPPPAVGGSERILVVDDEQIQLRTAQRILQQFGYEVITADSGEGALQLIQHGGPSGQFQLVILDMLMPGSLNGIATLERIRRLRPYQRALIATGYAPTKLNRVATLDGVTWLAKPYTAEALGAAVRSALETQHNAVRS